MQPTLRRSGKRRTGSVRHIRSGAATRSMLDVRPIILEKHNKTSAPRVDERATHALALYVTEPLQRHDVIPQRGFS